MSLILPSVSSTVPVIVMTPYDLWRTANGGAGIGGDSLDPAGDGVSNLMKYALGLSATTPATSVSLPIVQVQNGYLTIQFTHNPDATDITYMIQFSNDCKQWKTLATWSPTTPSWTLSADGAGAVVGETGGIVTATDNKKITDQTKRFLRLKVSN